MSVAKTPSRDPTGYSALVDHTGDILTGAVIAEQGNLTMQTWHCCRAEPILMCLMTRCRAH